MTDLKLGLLLWSQTEDWAALEDAARRADRLGYDHLWTWDHLYALNGDPYQSMLDGWMILATLAAVTERSRLGLLVAANPFRNPGIVAKMATTLDHVSRGRAILGIGGAWFELEHRAHGLDFGSGFGQRLDRLDEAAGVIRSLLDGRSVTSPPGSYYAFDDVQHQPLPIQPHLPIMIGGGGETKTLRTVAKYADMWNIFGDPDKLARKDAILRAHCADIGRDQSEIERTVGCKIVIRDTPEEAQAAWADYMRRNRTPEEEWDDATELWLGSPEQIAADVRSRMAVGFETLIAIPPPFDIETIERLIGEVKPLVDAG